MTIKQEYKAGLTRLRRIAGQYKRYGADFGQLLESVKRPTRGSIRRLKEIERRIRYIGEQAKREFDYKIDIDNFRSRMRDWAVSKTGNRLNAAMMEKSMNFINSVIDAALEENGYFLTVRELRKNYQYFASRVRALIRAIYDEEKEGLHLMDPVLGIDVKGRIQYATMASDVARMLGYRKTYTEANVSSWL